MKGEGGEGIHTFCAHIRFSVPNFRCSNMMMDWQVLEVLITRTDDIGVACALAQLNRFAPTVPPHIVREERQRRDRQRRDTETRKRRLLDELASLSRWEDDFILCERIDKWSIVGWRYVDGEDLDEDGDLWTRYIPALRRTGFWDM